jgi:hypothetical protein
MRKFPPAFISFFVLRFPMQDAADPDILTNILVTSHRRALLNFEEKMGEKTEELQLVDAKFHNFTDLRTSNKQRFAKFFKNLSPLIQTKSVSDS